MRLCTALLLVAVPAYAGTEPVQYVRVRAYDVTGCNLLTLQVDSTSIAGVMAFSVYDACQGGYVIAPASEPVQSTDLVVDRKGAARFQGLTFTRTAAKCATTRTPMGAYLTECPALVTGAVLGVTLDRAPATTGSYR
jgi:hypothetical protein